MKKKQPITLEDIFKQNAELYSNLVDCITKLEEKLTRAENVSQDTESRSENVQNDIPNTEYVTITADDVLVGGEPTRQYHGQDLYNYYHLTAYFKEARDVILEEYGYELLEIHCLQSSTDGEYAKTGNPVADKDGTNCWIRVVYLDKNKQKAVSLWAFNYTYSSASVCASNCTYNCGSSVRYNSSLRAGLFGKNDN